MQPRAKVKIIGFVIEEGCFEKVLLDHTTSELVLFMLRLRVDWLRCEYYGPFASGLSRATRDLS